MIRLNKCPFKTNLILNKQVLRATTVEKDPVKNKTSSERQKQFSFDDENELERGANSPPTNGRIDETTGT